MINKHKIEWIVHLYGIWMINLLKGTSMMSESRLTFDVIEIKGILTIIIDRVETKKWVNFEKKFK